jgi:hypothetical protein
MKRTMTDSLANEARLKRDMLCWRRESFQPIPALLLETEWSRRSARPARDAATNKVRNWGRWRDRERGSAAQTRRSSLERSSVDQDQNCGVSNRDRTRRIGMPKVSCQEHSEQMTRQDQAEIAKRNSEHRGSYFRHLQRDVACGSLRRRLAWGGRSRVRSARCGHKRSSVQDRVVWQEDLETVVKEGSGWKALYRACKDLN